MQVAMFMFWRGGEPEPAKRAASIEETGAFARELHGDGKLRGGNLLTSSGHGFRFDRVDDDDGSYTDGPFAEATEVLAGLLVVEVGSMDEARELAAGNPYAKFGTVEVRLIESTG